MELLEREPLLAALDSRLDAAATGKGSMVLLAGEAGIGKTSLARGFCDRHGADVDIWWGACDALATPRPLGPLYDIARVAGGDLASLMASDASRYERLSGFREALVSPLRPAVVVFEDVHWADEATRDLLVYLARRVADTNAVVVVTYRDDEIGKAHPLRDTLGHLATVPEVHRLTLPPLSEGAIRRLAEGHAADPAAVYRVSAGNPFFATEIIAAGADTVPETVSDAVLARAGRLSPAARAALDAAAIVPDRAEVGLVRAISGGGVDAVEECVNAGLLHPDGRSVRFRHELARLAVERDILPIRLPDLHTAALAHLRSQPDADPGRLSYHAGRAGDTDAVLRYAPAAAARAARLGAHHEAVAHLSDALRYAGALAPADRTDLLERYALECGSTGKETAAIDAAERAVAIARDLGEVLQQGRVLTWLASFLWRVARGEEANRVANEAIALLEQHPDSPVLARAYARAAWLRMLARDIPAAIDLGTRAIDIAERSGDDAVLVQALNAVGAARWFATPDEAESTLTRGLEIAHRIGDDISAGNLRVNLGSGAGEIRRYHTAERWLTDAVAWSTARDLDNSRDYCLAWSARTAFEQGRWSEATKVAGRVAGCTDVITRITALAVVGRLRARRGDPDPDTPLREAWQLAERTGDLQRLWPAAAGRAETAWLAGEPEKVADLVGDTYRLAVRLRQPWPIGELAFWLWKVGALDATPDGTAEPYALQINGDWRAAAAAWDTIGCPYEAALARADSDDPQQLRVALAAFGHLGARPMTELLAGRLRQLGVRDLPRRPSRATVDNPAGLTARELDVLRLLATGATNADIAARLHISPKTAGHHVSAILAKLGVGSRRDAARVARDWGLAGEDRAPDPLG